MLEVVEVLFKTCKCDAQIKNHLGGYTFDSRQGHSSISEALLRQVKPQHLASPPRITYQKSWVRHLNTGSAQGHAETVKVLLEYGADPTRKPTMGKSFNEARQDHSTEIMQANCGQKRWLQDSPEQRL